MRARTALAACSFAATAYAACADNDNDSEGRPDARVETRDARIPDDAADDGAPIDPDASRGLVPFCEAFKVMRTCRCCHFGEQPDSIGPFPLLSYEDTQKEYFGDKIYDRMRLALETDFMPLIDSCDDGVCVLDPPAKPLEPRCKQTLLDWIDQGALPTGGTNCDPDAGCQADIGCVPHRP